MVRDGYLFGAALFAVAAIVWFTTHMAVLAAVPVVLACFFLWFFRDPSRTVPTAPGLIVSPADGKVEQAEVIETEAGPRARITIFLNVFNVHVNRVPAGGTVELVEYKEGKYLNAMRPDSAVLNEQTMIAINTGDYVVVFKQIAGLLARRIVCNLQAGDRVVRGQRMGLIKFGSRTDVLLPPSAALRVKPGDHVKGGSSILAAMPAESLSGLEPVDGQIG
ncbi:MAG TPA: phosphatidylserine decarboxylase [Acidobacteriaceae bacterium]|jgi:phosphatidylserine decarboxylase